MNGKFLFGLAAAGCVLVVIGANAVTTSKNVDIVVTHGTSAALTTYTIQNTTSSTLLPNTPYIAGQSFRRGDVVAANNCVQIRDAASHTPLTYQLDEVSTRRENGDDGSIRHVVFSMLFPASSPQYSSGGIPPNGAYQIEFVPTSGPCSPGTTHQTLASLCAAHDIKIHFTDVRNQNGTLRDSGDMTFDTCANISNVGRDAPRHVAQGAARDTYIVSGIPVYTSGHGDPLIYVQCYLDVTTLADGVTQGPLRHVCRVDNSWMNVAAGSTGNSRAPGPDGFANDPQAVSYRPVILDGSADVLDWSPFDASVNSSSNPVNRAGDNNGTSVCTVDLNSNGNWNIPSSTGANAWQQGTALYYSTSGTPPAGMASFNNNPNPASQATESLIFVNPVGEAYTNPNTPVSNTNVVAFAQVPAVSPLCGAPPILATSEGSGAQNFSWRVFHYHWNSWYTLDQTGLENWQIGGSRVTSPLLPQFTTAEQTYWKETGTIPPLRLTTPVSAIADPTSYGGYSSYPYYQPLTRGLVIGGSGVGARPDIGLTNEFWSRAWLVQSTAFWQKARVFSLGSVSYPDATMLDETIGRIPELNNGPPGANHAGAGGSYPSGCTTNCQLGPPRFGVEAMDYNVFSGVAMTQLNLPVTTSNSPSYFGSFFGWGSGYRNDHVPSFLNGMYTIFGSRHYLDAMYFAGNRTHYQMAPGPGLSNPANGGATDDTIGGVHYYGLHYGQAEPRATGWALRDQMLPAFLGGDQNPERQYFNDRITETYYYVLAFFSQLGGGTSAITNALLYPYPMANTSGNIGISEEEFMDAYIYDTSWQAWALGHDPLSKIWIQAAIRMFTGWCGDHAGWPPSYYCALYAYDGQQHDSAQMSAYNGNITAALNLTDTSDVGDITPVISISNGSGTISWSGDSQNNEWAKGDLIKYDQCVSSPTSVACGSLSSTNIDQLNTYTWYRITGVSQSGASGTFQIINPRTGTPFTSYTNGGSPLTSNQIQFRVRHLTAPSCTPSPPTATCFSRPSYMAYVQALIYGFSDIGYSNAMAPLIGMIDTRGFYDPTNDPNTGSWLNWDPNVVVP